MPSLQIEHHVFIEPFDGVPVHEVFVLCVSRALSFNRHVPEGRGVSGDFKFTGVFGDKLLLSRLKFSRVCLPVFFGVSFEFSRQLTRVRFTLHLEVGVFVGAPAGRVLVLAAFCVVCCRLSLCLLRVILLNHLTGALKGRDHFRHERLQQNRLVADAFSLMVRPFCRYRL